MDMDKPPAITLQKCPQGLMPYGLHSAPMLDQMPIGQVFECKPRKGRTVSRNSAYWAGLNAAVAASEAWPTTQHLHDDLKRLCGYVDTYFNPLTNQQEIRVQSTAFSKMGEAEFAQYFRLAQMKFIRTMGFDPWSQGDAP